MNPRERILSLLRARASASYKECALGLNHRVDRDAVHYELKNLVAEGVIEVVSTKQVTCWTGPIPVAGTRSRYRLVRERAK
jgi:predicted ArsR family transcriptional regulator